MRHALAALLLLAAPVAMAGDSRWLAVAEATEHPELRELALALATSEADAEVHRAAARLVRALHAEPPALTEADAVTAELRVERARDAWRMGEVERAVHLLEPVRTDPLAAVLYAEAVDAWVSAERERLGRAYLAAKDGPRGERSAALREVRAGLEALLERYPDSVLAPALATNLERVERELEMYL